MAGAVTRRTTGLAGSAAVLVAIGLLAGQALDLYDEATRWMGIVGPITREGFALLALLLGTMMMAPMVVEAASSKLRAWRFRHQKTREKAAYFKLQLMLLKDEQLYELKSLLETGPRVCENAPGDFLVALRREDFKVISAIHPLAEKPLREHLEDRRKRFAESRAVSVKDRLLRATREERTIVWLFARPVLREPASYVLGKPELLSAIQSLHDSRIIKRHAKWQQPPARIDLFDDCVPHVESIVLGRSEVGRPVSKRVRRRSVQLADD